MHVVVATEVRVRHGRPGVAGVVGRTDVETEAEHRSIVEAEGTPAYVAGSVGPRHIRRGPMRRRNPEPRARSEAPAAVVMGGPGKRIDADPRPAVARIGRPSPVVIGPPRRRYPRVPDVAIGLHVAPVA